MLSENKYFSFGELSRVIFKLIVALSMGANEHISQRIRSNVWSGRRQLKQDENNEKL
jgi:hypothetical protein